MTTVHRNWIQKLVNTFSSVRTGIVLFFLLGVTSILGTLIVQRPMAKPGEIEKLYSPETIRLFDFFGLFDLFHTWWFAALLAVLGLNIVLASLDRLPRAWRYVTHPYRVPDEHFVRNLPIQASVPLAGTDEPRALHRVGAVLARRGYKPIVTRTEHGAVLFAEKHRYARLAAYVVHASLLIIVSGAVVDSIWGYRAFVTLGEGHATNQVALLGTEQPQVLPFTLRCEKAGVEKYPDGTPKRYWSRLTVLEGGRESLRKEIEVNDPLTYKGIRFYQASYGQSGEVSALKLRAARKDGKGAPQSFLLRPNQTVRLDQETSVSLLAFLPDFVIQGSQIFSRSDELNNPGIKLAVKQASGEVPVWLFPKYPQFKHPDSSPYEFTVEDIQMGYFTGLQVAKQPGQTAIWIGCVLLAVGLMLALYFAHVRYWALVRTSQQGRRELWMGGSTSKNKGEFIERFQELVRETRTALQAEARAEAEASLPAVVNS